MYVKKFNIYTNLNSRELRFFLHQMKHVDNIPTHVIAKVRGLKKKYDKRITLTDKELEIVEEFGKGSNFILNCIIYLDKGDCNEGTTMQITSRLKTLHYDDSFDDE